MKKRKMIRLLVKVRLEALTKMKMMINWINRRIKKNGWKEGLPSFRGKELCPPLIPVSSQRKRKYCWVMGSAKLINSSSFSQDHSIEVHTIMSMGRTFSEVDLLHALA